MLSTFALTLAAASLVAADKKYLFIKSEQSDLDGNSLGFMHEGAGINYAFLGTASSTTALDYDESTGELTQPLSGDNVQYLAASQYVALTVTGPNGEFTFDDDNTLLFNGTADGFYACKNTGDPYNYSTQSYELMYYASDAPSDCVAVTLVNKPSGGSSSTTTTLTSSTLPSSTSSAPAEPSTYTPTDDGANVPQVAAGAAALGLLAALL